MIHRKGYDALWCWFSLSYASWLTLPRVLMHEMPDEWQERMAKLLNEWDETWPNTGESTPCVQLREGGGRFGETPNWLINYRRPDKKAIEICRSEIHSKI